MPENKMEDIELESKTELGLVDPLTKFKKALDDYIIMRRKEWYRLDFITGQLKKREKIVKTLTELIEKQNPDGVSAALNDTNISELEGNITKRLATILKTYGQQLEKQKEMKLVR